MSSVAFFNKEREVFEGYADSTEDEEDEVIEDPKFSLPEKDVPIPKPICPKKEEWLLERIKRCQVINKFRVDPIEEIEEKTTILEELLVFFRGDPGPMSKTIYSEMFEMFSNNLCRKIPQITKRTVETELENHVLEEAWPHLKTVYEIFIKFMEMRNLRLDFSKMYMGERFMYELIQLMDSDDPREKDMAKTAVHRIYSRFYTSRPYLRKELTNILLKYIYDTEHFSGISEILQIFSCIINGLSLPLSKEFVVLLTKVLVPLHKVKNMSMFHQQLIVCLVNYLHKDTGTLKIIIEGLIKYWPKINSQKEVQFLSEIEELIEVVDSKSFAEVQTALFTQIAKCVLSTHFQVVEKSLALFNNPWAWYLVEENYKTILPIIMPSLLQRRTGHWNQTVAVLVNNVLKMFRAINKDFFTATVIEASKPPVEEKTRRSDDEFSYEEELSKEDTFDPRLSDISFPSLGGK